MQLAAVSLALTLTLLLTPLPLVGAYTAVIQGGEVVGRGWSATVTTPALLSSSSSSSPSSTAAATATTVTAVGAAVGVGGGASGVGSGGVSGGSSGEVTLAPGGDLRVYFVPNKTSSGGVGGAEHTNTRAVVLELGAPSSVSGAGGVGGGSVGGAEGQRQLTLTAEVWRVAALGGEASSSQGGSQTTTPPQQQLELVATCVLHWDESATTTTTTTTTGGGGGGVAPGGWRVLNAFNHVVVDTAGAPLPCSVAPEAGLCTSIAFS